MARLDGVGDWLDETFAGKVAAAGVPGAAIAVLAGDEVVERAAGILNLRTGLEATTDSVFQIGSITKVWTATLVMQLVDDGLLDLDEPVRRYLPSFRVADEVASAAVTVRQLLCHCGGFEGDFFVPTTRDDDAIEKYVEEVVPGIPQHAKPGEVYSYCNAGYSILGRITEVLIGTSWAQALRTRLVEPLGLQDVSTRAEEAILFRPAIGHVRPAPDGPLEPTKLWALDESMAPAGAMVMSARSVLALARLYLAGGVAPDGRRLLSTQSVASMWRCHIEVPGHRTGGWGLGWGLYDWPGGKVVGHNGGLFGQQAFLRVVPQHDVAIALLANSESSVPLYLDVFTHLLGELCGISVPAPSEPPAESEPITNAERYIGRYEFSAAQLKVEEVRRGGLELVVTQPPEAPERLRLVRLTKDVLIVTEQQNGTYDVCTFLGDDGAGRARFLHIAGKAIPRVG
ncbi:serine hydrolase domain-containing protein [Flindersiella endophytica]